MLELILSDVLTVELWSPKYPRSPFGPTGTNHTHRLWSHVGTRLKSFLWEQETYQVDQVDQQDRSDLRRQIKVYNPLTIHTVIMFHTEAVQPWCVQKQARLKSCRLPNLTTLEVRQALEDQQVLVVLGCQQKRVQLQDNGNSQAPWFKSQFYFDKKGLLCFLTCVDDPSCLSSFTWSRHFFVIF